MMSPETARTLDECLERELSVWRQIMHHYASANTELHRRYSAGRISPAQYESEEAVIAERLQEARDKVVQLMSASVELAQYIA